MTPDLWLVIALALLLVWSLLPRIGLLAIYRALRATREREHVEDALKHLLDREQHARFASPESLAGTLGLPQSRAMRLIAAMEEQGLLVSQGAEIHLTPAGERWAMHVMRAHRLWERYLADEARMPLAQIHGEAQRREHRMTHAELDDLDAALGHPARDPHGDLIPTREGTLPRAEGTPATAWQDGRLARIVHLEDEPALAYEQILATGLRLGQDVRIIERTPQAVVLSDGENEYRLAPTVASNIFVAPLPESEMLRRAAVPLSELTQDQRGEIVKLGDAVQGLSRRRFLDLGLTPGAVVYPELGNFFGDPRAYRVRGTLIALRQDQAAQIWVNPV